MMGFGVRIDEVRKKGKCLTAVERREKLRILQEKIERDEADASIAIGFPSFLTSSL